MWDWVRIMGWSVVSGLVEQGNSKEEAIEQLKENVDRQKGLFESTRTFKVIALSGTEPTPVEGEVLKELAVALDGQYCRHGCAACAAACPSPVPVSNIMHYAYYFEGQGHAMARYAALEGANGAACHNCSAPWVGACPHGVDVPYQMHRAHALLTLA